MATTALTALSSSAGAAPCGVSSHITSPYPFISIHIHIYLIMSSDVFCLLICIYDCIVLYVALPCLGEVVVGPTLRCELMSLPRHPCEASLVENLCQRYRRGAGSKYIVCTASGSSKVYRCLQMSTVKIKPFLSVLAIQRIRWFETNCSLLATSLLSCVGLIYTNVSQVLLAVNPHRYLDHLYGEVVMRCHVGNVETDTDTDWRWLKMIEYDWSTLSVDICRHCSDLVHRKVFSMVRDIEGIWGLIPWGSLHQLVGHIPTA